MVDTDKKFKLSAVYAAVLSVVSTGAIAQEQQADTQQANTEEEIEVIEVRGLKSSLRKSINDKRFADGVVDTINAEDIGKNTDQNIADALGRVTGVSVVSGSNGEGSQITVRGASANQNNITLNGQQLTSTDFSQAVDLSSFSADILSKLEVAKTASADQDEGSLGANVNLVTIKPLDQTDDIRSFQVQGRYNDFSEEADYKVQLSLSEKFLDETFGVALSVYDETNTYRKDQYRVDNFVASKVIDIASDQNGEILSGPLKGIQQNATRYELHQNTHDRSGATLGLQWLATDTTEITFDATYTKAEQTNLMDAVITRFPGNENFVEGEAPLGSLRPEAPFTDPQADWYTLDTNTHTFTKLINRFGAGDLQNATNGNESTNTSARIEIKQEITDNFRGSLAAGYSLSESDSLPSAFAAMQNFPNVPAVLLYDALENIEPVGYDCTTGQCQLVHGSTFVDLGDQIVDAVDPDTGAFIPKYIDNVAYTGYNPADIAVQHLSYLSETDRYVEDELANVQLDFEYDLDVAGITSVEFGAKMTTRTKTVDDQVYQFDTVTASEVFEDEYGNPVVVPGGSMLDVRAPLIAREGGLPYSDFMSSLGYGRNEATAGWTPVDAAYAASIMLDAEDTVRTPDNTRSREADIDTQAAYLKVNFEYLDGRLTGNLGVRYVKTDVEAKGYAGANFWQFTETLEREFDLVHLRDLRDTSLPACRAPVFADPTQSLGYEQKYQRVDGLGFDTSSGADPSGWTEIAAQGPCHDPAYASWAAFQQDPTQPDPGFNVNWLNMWRYADVSTTRANGWGMGPGNVTWDGTTPATNSANQHPFTNVTNKELQSFAASDSHSYENFLPSLNVNYAFTDELIGRFAASKTMTRPEIDNLRPGFSLNETGYWGTGNSQAGSRLDMYNTKLDPLESNNLDISLEWYFNETGMLSAAVFHKDMKNFEDKVSTVSYITDVRTATEAPTAEELIMNPMDDGTDDWGLNGCMPLRATADYGWWGTDPNRFSSDLRDLCAQYSVTQVANGDGATITGLELGYIQTYDFLPGFLSGLGVSANYTYQDSAYDAQVSPFDPTKSLPEYPVADTPEHSYNGTLFWEQNGHQVRLSYRGTSDSLVGTDYNTGLKGRTWNQGSIWNEGRGTLDFSASYQLNENVMFTFQAINLTDAEHRTYFTSREIAVDRVWNADNAAYEFLALDEGNPLDGDATKSRTYTRFKVGTTFRLGVRVNF
ncbi:TonB-dependent receptor [Thalassotalea agarivorans]|uniref:TonB-dependent receptor n=1 Tax=Thalassotalea agarivorans TaxID=349064 RepID=A0A1I0DYP6_THASX|nr:TonB-dependent receptor [Thalassotalea agarivorans]SET37869.1 TonB-dependent receptor [Thalassotalea agarivorans]